MPETESLRPTKLLNGEKLIGLGEAARSLPGYRENTTMHPSALLRWVTHGARGQDGQLKRLEAVRLGSRWLTSHESLARFSSALACTATNETPIRSPTAQNRAGVSAGDRLEAMGA